MSTIIYPSPIFGPVHSRRLGISLGINLLPADGKVCSFDCIYCECGFNEDHRPTLPLPTREEVAEKLEAKLQAMVAEGQLPDVLTFAGNGEPMIVTKQNEAAAQAERFRQYINTPVLTRIQFNPGSFQAYDIEPASVPDMMAERPILIFGKYKGKPQGTVSLTGKVGRKPFKQSYNLSNLKADPANSALRYLWARERIKYLSYLDNNQTPTAKQILELGLKYNLMTQYTSFVAIDEEIVNKDGKQTTVKQPIPMPEGVSDYAVGHSAPTLSATSNKLRAVEAVAIVEEEEVEEEIFMVVEEDPEFPGGIDSLYAFIRRNLHYPEEAWNNKIEGTVYVTFSVEKDGSISNVKLLRDIGGGCGAEAVRVVKLMPKWKPGKQRGIPVRTQFNLPIKFKMSAN